MSTLTQGSRLEVKDNGGITVVNFIDQKILDKDNIQGIGEGLFSLIDQYGKKKILLNFANVEYLSCAAYGKLITLNKKVGSAGGKLVMCNLNDDTMEVFKMTRLDRLFNIEKDEQTALTRF